MSPAPTFPPNLVPFGLRKLAASPSSPDISEIAPPPAEMYGCHLASAPRGTEAIAFAMYVLICGLIPSPKKWLCSSKFGVKPVSNSAPNLLAHKYPIDPPTSVLEDSAFLPKLEPTKPEAIQ